MKILVQLAIILGVSLLSALIEFFLPFPFPASIIAMLILLILLILKIIKVDSIKTVGTFLTENISFFFVPAIVSIMNYISVFYKNLFAFAVIIIVSTLLTYAATAFTVKLVQALINRREKQS